MEIVQILTGAATGLASGFLWSMTGYGVNKMEEGETLDYSRLGKGMFTGAVIGGVAGACGYTAANYEELISWGNTFILAGTFALTPAVQKIYGLAKGFLRKIYEKIV